MLSSYQPFQSLAKHPKISFWSGLGAVVIGIGFELSGAAKLAAVCFIVTWVIWSLVIYFSNFWQKSKRFSIVGMIVIAAALGLFWWLYLPPPVPSAAQIAEEVWKRAPTRATPSPTQMPTPPVATPHPTSSPAASRRQKKSVPNASPRCSAEDRLLGRC
jgi:hypothetical protein